MNTSPPFPTGPDQLNGSWLCEVTSAPDDRWEITPVPGGFWSQMIRASHDTAGSFVLKFADPSDHSRFVCDLFGFNRVELGFYRDLAPRSPVRVARPVHLDHSEDHADYVIVMSDLGRDRQYDQLVGCPDEAAGLVVDALARLHAHYWAADELSALHWLPGPSDPALAERLPMVVAAVSDQAFENLDVPPPILDAWPRFLAELPTLLHRLDDQALTLAHGDVRLSNLFFGEDDVAFVDWQVARRTHGAYDVAYFLTQSLATETRRRLEADLLDRYRTGLVEHGVAPPSVDALADAYRLCALYCLVYPIIAASNGDGTASTDALEVAERAFTATIDLEALDLL